MSDRLKTHGEQQREIYLDNARLKEKRDRGGIRVHPPLANEPSASVGKNQFHEGNEKEVFKFSS
jgi:hypothetical protein